MLWYNHIKKHLPEIEISEIDAHCVLIDDKIRLHQDIFERRKHQTLSRLDSLYGKNLTNIFARNTTVVKLSKEEAVAFINQNHLLGFGGGKTFLGLRDDTELVAVAIFSKILYMKYEDPPYHSVELERYCSLTGSTVTGGLDKLIKAYLKDHDVDDIVTYIDKEWSDGSSYLNLGFDRVDETAPLKFKVNLSNWERQLINDESSLTEEEYLVENQGNIKMRMTIAQAQG